MLWILTLFFVVYAIGWFAIWPWLHDWYCALRKPGYEQFGHKPKSRGLGVVFADGPQKVKFLCVSDTETPRVLSQVRNRDLDWYLK